MPHEIAGLLNETVDLHVRMAQLWGQEPGPVVFIHRADPDLFHGLPHEQIRVDDGAAPILAHAAADLEWGGYGVVVFCGHGAACPLIRGARRRAALLAVRGGNA